jgi:(p)ppGpp synthase/HD superfamily hydrolase
MAIAVLHDVVEDCSITFDDLRELGMTQRVIDGVDLLTKRPDLTYFQFIERLAGNRDALLVKREDLRDNSDLARLKVVTEKDLKRMDKYMNALRRVEELLRILDGHTSNE